MEMPDTQIMDGQGISRAIDRMAHEILEHNRGPRDMVIVGIRTRGAIIAERLARSIEKIEKLALPVGAIDITFHRDDIQGKLEQPIVQKTDLLFSIDDKIVILVDDVLFTGRTARAALNELSDYGRPRCIRLAVLVDRGHRELPLRADYVGIELQTFRDETVVVNLVEQDGSDSVILRQKSEAPQ